MKHRMVPAAIAIVLLLGACSDSATDAQSVAQESEAAEPTSTAVPEPTATAEPLPTATAVPEPTAEPTEVPTAEPVVESSATPGSGCGAGVAPGTTTETFDFQGVERVFERVVPEGYDDTTALPVVLNWHGLGSNGPDQIGFSDYANLADAETFIVIAPTGLASPGDDRNSWELTDAQDPGRDDLAFANALLDLVIETLCVDESRVYTTGMSNGGYFSSVLVCEMSERIAAAASVAALTHADDCDPERSVPYIGFHGTDDAVVPYAGGGESSLAPGQSVPLFELKILDEFAEFATDAGCDVDPMVEAVSDNVTAYDFSDCTDGVAMTFYEIAAAGHTWPGSALSLAISEAVGLGVTTDEISASQVSWDFFEQHSLPTN